MKDSYANKVRQALITLGHTGQPVNTADLAAALDLVSKKDKHPMYTALCDMRNSGEIERVAPSVHVYRGKPSAKPEIRSAMWAVLRMRRTVTLDDLRELTGVSKGYAKQFLGLLARRGVIERIPRARGVYVYRLVQDLGPQAPEDNEKAAALRRLREAKKTAIEKLDMAGRALIDATQALVRARIAVNDIPEEGGGDDNE